MTGDLLVADTVEELYPRLLWFIVSNGVQVAPAGRATIEVSPLMFQLLDPRKRIVTHKGRRLNHPLAVMKQLQLLSGTSDMDALRFYDKGIDRLIDPVSGVYDGAYGPRLKPQLDYVLQVLQRDPASRRAVIAIFEPSDQGRGLDQPSTMTLQYLIRDNRLHAITYMRSNDAWGGLPYDLCLFPFLQEVLASWLQVPPGTYTHITGSGHVYASDVDNVRALVADPEADRTPAPPPFELSFQSTQVALREFLEFERRTRVGLSWQTYTMTSPDSYLSWCSDVLAQYRPH